MIITEEFEMTILNLMTVPHEMFSVSKENGVTTLVAYSAELNHAGYHHNSFFNRVFDDACDCGFKIKGHTTELIFTYVDNDSDGEDVAGWKFSVCNPSRNPKYDNIKVLIIND